MMSVKSEMLGARDEFISLVRNELLGPGSEVSVPDAEHELITTSPEKRYSIGILFPQGNRVKADNGDVDRDSEEDEAADDFEMSDEETVAEPEDNVERKADITEKQDKSDDADDDRLPLEFPFLLRATRMLYECPLNTVHTGKRG